VQRFGRLDVLVHAAGLLAKLTPAAHIPPRDWSESLAGNATAAYRLIRACDPPLRAAPAGRAIFLHDSHATEPTPYWSLYSTAKAAQAHLVQCWATELTMTPLRVALVDPGPVATNLRAAAFPGEDQAKLRQPAELGAAIVALLGQEFAHGATLRI